jgi:hypothetical protein
MPDMMLRHEEHAIGVCQCGWIVWGLAVMARWGESLWNTREAPL